MSNPRISDVKQEAAGLSLELTLQESKEAMLSAPSGSLSQMENDADMEELIEDPAGSSNVNTGRHSSE